VQKLVASSLDLKHTIAMKFDFNFVIANALEPAAGARLSIHTQEVEKIS
jgi:hypothetical protein